MHDVARWVAALSTLIGFGLMMGLNPALYGAAADMLARNTKVAARMSWLVGGVFTGATLLYVLLQSINPTSFVTAAEQSADTALLNRAVDLVAGGVFVAAAVAVALWRLRVPAPHSRAPKPVTTRDRSWSYFPLGLSCAIVGFTTLPIMYMTGRIAAGISTELLPRLFAYGVFLLALGAPFVLLAVAWSRFPIAAARVNGVYTRIIHIDFRWAYAAILAIAGIVAIGFGLTPAVAAAALSTLR